MRESPSSTTELRKIQVFKGRTKRQVVEPTEGDVWRCTSGPLGVQLECDHPFSWKRFFISMFSYALVLSDVIRSGLGISSLNKHFAVQPDSFIAFGPYAYRVVHLNTTNATSGAHRTFWAYKYDTTSLGMRSVAEHLQLPAWSPCLLYREKCVETDGLAYSTVFAMINSMVDAVADKQLLRDGPGSMRADGQLTLRTLTGFRDRLHHYVFPSFFDHPTKRTTQAIYYSQPTQELCGFASPRPYACREFWTKYFKGLCGRTPYRSCNSTLWTDIPQRHRGLLKAYPDHTLDFVIVDTANDVANGGLSYQGRQDFDVVVFTRIRSCISSDSHHNQTSSELSCTTVAVDDYRYESAYFTMDAPSWFSIVATLRIFGQAYMWLRVLGLFWGCYLVSTHTSSPNERQPVLSRRLVKTIKMVFLIPSQVVIYGSLTPIVAHASAHLIDSPATYEIIASYFNSLLGDFTLNPQDFLRLCSVSMRTVWTLAVICHVAVSLATAQVWSPLQGTLGIPEFSISVVACATILMQYRSVDLRHAPVLAIHEVLSSQHRRRHFLGQSKEMMQTTLQKFVSGNPIDSKCIATTVLALVVLLALAYLLHNLFPKRVPFWVQMVQRTPVPTSAGRLWTRNHLVVSWFDTVFKKKSNQSVLKRVAKALSMKAIGPSPPPSARALATNERISSQAMTAVDTRSRDVESMILLVNVAAMTDPITFLQLRVFGGHEVGLYESTTTGRRMLLPYGLAQTDADVPIDWTKLQLIAVKNTKELSWHELLCCG